MLSDPAEPRIGPNAIIQLHRALADRLGPARAREALHVAELDAYAAAEPTAMTPEAEAARFFAVVRARLCADDFAEISAEAGRRTADYVLEHRIPKPAQALLRLAPPRLAARLLARAVSRAAWTFAGGASFALPPVARGQGALAVFEIGDGLMARSGGCAWRAAAFQRLFEALASRDAVAVETACVRSGAARCRFEIRRA